MLYGQFCPIAKACEILGDKWTLLILRELLMGGRRFNEIQRGLGSISTALLTARLKFLCDQGLVLRRSVAGTRGHEYHPTSASKELRPIIVSLGEWGLKWAKENLVDEDYDVELLMLYLERGIAVDMLPGSETVLQFTFSDLRDLPQWWLIATKGGVEVCVKDPGRDVDLYLACSVRTMTDVWLGHRTYKDAMNDGDLSIVGPRALVRTIGQWLRFGELPAASRS